MINKTEMVSVPRELLERLLSEACNENWSDLNRLLATYRAAPAEDVRAVEDEPVLWFKQLPPSMRNASGRNYEVFFCELPGYEPLYRRPLAKGNQNGS